MDWQQVLLRCHAAGADKTNRKHSRLWLKLIGSSTWKRQRAHCNADTAIRTLIELISIKSKCIFHNADESAFVHLLARSRTQKCYLQWLSSQEQMVLRRGGRQVTGEKGKVRKLFEEAWFK